MEVESPFQGQPLSKVHIVHLIGSRPTSEDDMSVPIGLSSSRRAAEESALRGWMRRPLLSCRRPPPLHHDHDHHIIITALAAPLQLAPPSDELSLMPSVRPHSADSNEAALLP